MASAKALTGGTGDVNPQALTFNVIQTGADTTTTLEVPIPIPRFSAKKDKAIVFEVLRTEVLIDNFLNSGTNQGLVFTVGTVDNPLAIDATTFLTETIDVVFASGVGFAFVPR